MSTPQVVQASNGQQTFVEELNRWVELEKAAIRLISAVGTLYYDKGVELVLFRKPLHNQDASEIINHHSYARNVSGKSMTVHDSVALAEEMVRLPLAPSRIDLGKLLTQWLEEKNQYANPTDFLNNRLGHLIGEGRFDSRPKDVVLYGFGRIGRLLARELVAQAGKGLQLRLRAIVARSYSDKDLFKRASLLRYDSIHGHFAGTIIEDPEKKALIINGHQVFIIDASNPEDIDYTQYGIENALLIDNTGAWRDREGLSRHLQAKGIDKVLLTAPGKGDIPNIVYGVNHEAFDLDEHRIWSAASCTTNAVVPVVKVIDEHLGIEQGHIETVHAYTNDQNLLDNYHKGYRRGRSAALNMVITETGAAKAVFKVFPHLKGRLTGNAVRVPVPNGSLAILMLRVKKAVTTEEVNNLMRREALYGDLVEQIEYAYSNDLVSSDIVGNSCASIFDSKATIVSEDGHHITLYVWYDNEYGYTRQVVRLAKHLAKVRRPTYY
ncbi:MAG: glyceraldehyde-3-phosphate dehydrogenase [Flavobacteriales bacterium]|nr:glyceraldehyde-3-phosphate dehydrogenase [Flavobacteriales bacterium]MCX7768980.1 glyceraldehyde-3-phosphate dehydrogenase [Flavobacteriales bacterium]MDW8410273.1 glyceraldehyde-3-phosphate dehydrogenase [Flavobacteriales bacterium]